MPFPSTARLLADLPALAEEHVVAGAAATSRLGEPLIITGRFQLSAARRATLGCEPHRALTLTTVVGLAGSCHGGLPFASTALCADDIHDDGLLVTGWFTVDAATVSGFRYAGVHHLTCSLDGLIALPVRIVVA